MKKGRAALEGPTHLSCRVTLGVFLVLSASTCSILCGSHFLLSEEREFDKPCFGMLSPSSPPPPQRLGAGGRLSAVSSLGVSLLHSLVGKRSLLLLWVRLQAPGKEGCSDGGSPHLSL